MNNDLVSISRGLCADLRKVFGQPVERHLTYEHELPIGFIFRYSDGTREYVSRGRSVKP